MSGAFKIIRVIGTIKKTDMEFLRTAVMEYNGNQYLDIRKFTIDGRGHEKPGSGISIGSRRLPDLLEHLRSGMLALNGEEPF